MKKYVRLTIIGAVLISACMAMSSCGTAVNSTVAAWEKNTATNAIQAEINTANAATFAVLNTPVYVLPFLQPNQRACIADLSVTDASKAMTNIINATAPTAPVPAPVAPVSTGVPNFTIAPAILGPSSAK